MERAFSAIPSPGYRYGYDPYGNTTTHTGTAPNPWGYAGGYTDTTGLIKFGTRYYDAALGRWTQQDPIGGSIANPNALDRYNYVACNPISGKDPSGLSCLTSESEWVIGIAIFAASLALVVPTAGASLVIFGAISFISGVGLGFTFLDVLIQCGGWWPR